MFYLLSFAASTIPGSMCLGYGLSNGHQNLVIVVDGRRLNNIDNGPQLLSSIPIQSIAKIEILKGAGSVEFGDGANAGVISITTKDFNGVEFNAYTGSFDTDYASLGLGYANDLLSISAFGDYYETDGQRNLQTTSDKKDASRSKNGNFNLKLYPSEGLEIRAGWAATRISTTYANSLTLAQYKENPSQAGSGFTEQTLDSDLFSLGVDYDITDEFNIDINLFTEDKTSIYPAFSSKYEYDYNSAEAKLRYNKNSLKVVTGFFAFNGERKASNNTTSKDNLAAYVKTDYKIDSHSFSAGV
ncbi:MAG TPA: TonB-dependent receptor, partial [Sulfurimonas sp.]|nr:TonB-dependent receptor [Sulfurimonas sp.]